MQDSPPDSNDTPCCIISGWRVVIGPPAYLQQHTPMHYDLTVIVPKEGSAGGSSRQRLLEEVAAVDMSEPDGFPLEALQQLTTLDRAQAEAIKVWMLPCTASQMQSCRRNCFAASRSDGLAPLACLHVATVSEVRCLNSCFMGQQAALTSQVALIQGPPGK
jgi:hypothetical protein